MCLIEYFVMGPNYQICVWFNCLLWGRTTKYLFYWTDCYGAELSKICLTDFYGAELPNICFNELLVMGPNYQFFVWFNCLLWDRTTKYLFDLTACYGTELPNICFIELFVMKANYQRRRTSGYFRVPCLFVLFGLTSIPTHFKCISGQFLLVIKGMITSL